MIDSGFFLCNKKFTCIQTDVFVWSCARKTGPVFPWLYYLGRWIMALRDTGGCKWVVVFHRKYSQPHLYSTSVSAIINVDANHAKISWDKKEIGSEKIGDKLRWVCCDASFVSCKPISTCLLSLCLFLFKHPDSQIWAFKNQHQNIPGCKALINSEHLSTDNDDDNRHNETLAPGSFWCVNK